MSASRRDDFATITISAAARELLPADA